MKHKWEPYIEGKSWDVQIDFRKAKEHETLLLICAE